jgi:hypothetical protein
LKYLYAPIALLVLICWTAPTVGASEKKTIEQELMLVAPDEMPRLWDSSTVVARVVITRSEVRGHENGGPYPDVFSEYDARVLETFRGATGKQLHFMHRAGTLETNEVFIHVANAEPLTVGAEYIVFLRHVPILGSFVLAAGQEAAFELSKGFVTPRGRGLIASQHQAMPAGRFVAELRDLAKTHPQRETAP